MIDRSEALNWIKKHVKDPETLKHTVMVAAIMKGVADRLGEDTGLWEVVGILHDFDYELMDGDFDKHGLIAADLLADVLPDEAIHAIMAHNTRISVPAESKMDQALIAADAVSHLLEELIEPKKRFSTVNVRSLRRKIDESGVTTTSGRFISPDIIKLCCEGLCLSVEEFLAIGLNSTSIIKH